MFNRLMKSLRLNALVSTWLFVLMTHLQSRDAAVDAAAESVRCNRDVITVLARRHSTTQRRQQLWTQRARAE